MTRIDLQGCLRRLIEHLDVSRVAVTGGVAIELHIDAARSGRTRSCEAEDIDFVAESPEAVLPSVTTGFLVSHFHLPQPGYSKFMVQLVDPVTRIRLDFFPDALRALPRAAVTPVAGVPLLVLRADDILDHKLGLLSRASTANPVEAKHYSDARELGILCGRPLPPIANSPAVPRTYSRDVGETCVRCDASQSRGFPLASKQAILDVLGYI